MSEIRTVQFACYGKLSGRRTYIDDVTSVTRPPLENMSDTVSGAGIAGEMDIPSMGQFGSLSYEVAFRSCNPKVAALMEQKTQEIEVIQKVQKLDHATGNAGFTTKKDIVKGIPKSLDPGTVENNAANESTLSLEVLYWKHIQDDKTLWEIDKLNGNCVINGVDYGKEIQEGM